MSFGIPKQFEPTDAYMVVNITKGTNVESQPTLAAARHAAQVLQAHNDRCSGSYTYVVRNVATGELVPTAERDALSAMRAEDKMTGELDAIHDYLCMKGDC